MPTAPEKSVKPWGALMSKKFEMPAVEKWRSPEAVRAQNAYRVLVEKALEEAQAQNPTLVITMPKLYQTSCSADDKYCDPGEVIKAIRSGCDDAGISVEILPSEEDA